MQTEAFVYDAQQRRWFEFDFDAGPACASHGERDNFPVAAENSFGITHASNRSRCLLVQLKSRPHQPFMTAHPKLVRVENKCAFFEAGYRENARLVAQSTLSGHRVPTWRLSPLATLSPKVSAASAAARILWRAARYLLRSVPKDF